MSYTPINWQTGDTITADKLNRCDNGWSVESSSQTYFTETVTTELDPEYPDDPASGGFAYSAQITADTVIVTFDGTDYTCQRMDGDPGSYVYGGWSDDSIDFSTIPFCIFSEDGYNSVVTETGGTYAISVAGTSQSIETSEQFRAAVESIANTSAMPMLCVSGTTTLVEMNAAYAAGRILFFRPYAGVKNTCFITSFTASAAAFIPALSGVTATFENGVFTVTVSA